MSAAGGPGSRIVWLAHSFNSFGHQEREGTTIGFHEAFVEFFLAILRGLVGDPFLYLLVLFVYGILTAIVLPIPIELALFIRPENMSPFLIAGVLGLSKMVGASLIFILGLRVEGPIRYYSARYPILGRMVGYITRFVRVTKWVGLFVLLAIPLLPDTLPIYLYSLFNKQGQLIPAWVFLLVNLVAGTVRALIFFFFAELFGVQLLL
ncbi:MAG: hypothetical protein R3291_04790 [Thermoplasmata archaeon]|nr:hypothetical protein [Thermoplasmata archaeon]